MTSRRRWRAVTWTSQPPRSIADDAVDGQLVELVARQTEEATEDRLVVLAEQRRGQPQPLVDAGESEGHSRERLWPDHFVIDELVELARGQLRVIGRETRIDAGG